MQGDTELVSFLPINLILERLLFFWARMSDSLVLSDIRAVIICLDVGFFAIIGQARPNRLLGCPIPNGYPTTWPDENSIQPKKAASSSRGSFFSLFINIHHHK